jgi:hypothetical protein
MLSLFDGEFGFDQRKFMLSRKNEKRQTVRHRGIPLVNNQ